MDLSSTQFMKSQVFIEKIEMRFQVIDYYLFLFFPSKQRKKSIGRTKHMSKQEKEMCLRRI